MTTSAEEVRAVAPGVDEVVPAGSRLAPRLLTVLVVVGVGAAGFGFRLWMMNSKFGYLNGDEAVTGLMTLRILQGHLPAMVAGQAYSGTVESFLAAPIVFVTGPSAAALKWVNIAVWAGAAVATYHLGRLVLGRAAAIAAALIFWVASFSALWLSIHVYSGYASGLLAVVTCLYVSGRQIERVRPTVAGAASAGLLAGLAVWLHPMYLALVLPALLVVTWRFRSVVMAWLVPAAAGSVVGLSPMLLYNVVERWPSLHPPPPINRIGYVSLLQRFVTETWPRFFGFRTVGGAWVSSWSRPAYVVLLVIAAVGLVHLLSRGWAARMVGVTGLAAPFVLAFFPQLSYVGDGRYGVAMVVPFAIGLVATAEWALRARPRTAAALLIGLPVAWLVVVMIPSFTHTGWDRTAIQNDDISALTRRLDELGVRRVRIDYFDGQRVVYLTDQRILAADLPPALNRFPYLEHAVDGADPQQVAYVFVAGHPPKFDSFALPAADYRAIPVGRFVVYVPRPAP